jgi:hypothetical protein
MLYYVFLIYYKLKYGIIDEKAIIKASKNGDVQFLEWFKNSGYEFKYNNNPIYYASRYGHIEVLEWFKNSGYEFKYNKFVIIYASYNRNIKVLEWFKNSGYKFKYSSENVIMFASENEHNTVLEWFKNYCNIKKIIKISNSDYRKTIKFKTKNNYIKGYNKN